MIHAYGGDSTPLMPPGTYPTKPNFKKYLKDRFLNGKYFHLIHVKRYRKI
jgi:hypothetical protein